MATVGTKGVLELGKFTGTEEAPLETFDAPVFNKFDVDTILFLVHNGTDQPLVASLSGLTHKDVSKSFKFTLPPEEGVTIAAGGNATLKVTDPWAYLIPTISISNGVGDIHLYAVSAEGGLK